ncbi:hypothetical protein GM661_03760 [Iocasia frigidifontis]|uniref:Type II secretion system protein K n=1 Tax=Iocasia fonsfrigidae TaxID=2682810 RepID=A0A8A7K5V2_9FIRM|nr:helix-hairpin-helix domain-containing protein [Iocasia fonsfrigidae]QTL97153.1 hypothetical protein GM661_03760 [Iocasia fonsfrigidae]
MSIIKNEEGYTLIIVIWAVVILSFIFINLVDEISLDRHLAEYEIGEKKIRQVEISALNMAINKLRQDETTTYDGPDDEWVEGILTEINDINCQVMITDYGSKININFIDIDLLTELPWWNEEISEVLDEGLISDPVLLKDVLGDNYKSFISSFTTLGKFNINNDSLAGLTKFLSFYGLSEDVINTIENNLKKFRKEKKSFQNIEDLPIKIKGIDYTTIEKIANQFILEGRININLVSEEVLDTLKTVLGLNEKTSEELITYRNSETIDDLGVLKDLISEEDYKKIKPYLTTSSSFFVINIKLTDMADNILRETEVVIEREYPEEDESQVEIIKYLK